MGQVTQDMPFFECNLLNKTLNIKILKKLCIPQKLSCEYFFSEGVPLKYVNLGLFSQAKAQKPKRQVQWASPRESLTVCFFYTQQVELSWLLQKLNYLTCAYRRGEGGIRAKSRNQCSPSATFLWLYHDNFGHRDCTSVLHILTDSG